MGPLTLEFTSQREWEHVKLKDIYSALLRVGIKIKDFPYPEIQAQDALPLQRVDSLEERKENKTV